MPIYASTPKSIEVVDLLNSLRTTQLGEDKSSIVDKPNDKVSPVEEYLRNTFLSSEEKAQLVRSEIPRVVNASSVPLLSQLPPGFGGFTEEGLKRELEVLEIPPITFGEESDKLDEQTKEVLSVEQINNIASSAIDAAGEAQDNQPNLDDVPTGGLGSPIREPGFSPIEEAIKEKTSKFYLDIGIHAESDHGDIPKPTNDAREKDKPKPVDNFNPKTSEKSLDIAYGHKITQEEHETGLIHGIKFKEESGYKEGRERFVLLTDEQKRFILEKDMEQNLKNARSGPDGWDAKLNKFGGTWDELDYKYKNALTSLAYNVRKPKQWNLVLKAAMDEDVKEFAKELRRKDAGEITKGMDNRVAKELYYSGIIENFSDVSDVLTKTNAKNVGMPK